jgi:hypothetical protein
MQKNPLISFLAGALCVAALGVFLLTIYCEWRFRQLRYWQPMAVQAQQKTGAANLLADDCIEYGRTHPAIKPILVNAGVMSSK